MREAPFLIRSVYQFPKCVLIKGGPLCTKLRSKRVLVYGFIFLSSSFVHINVSLILICMSWPLNDLHYNVMKEIVFIAC